MFLFDVKMYYYCEIIMYNIFCSIKNQLHVSSFASRGQKIVLPRNTCIFPWNKLFLYHAELYTTSLLPKNQGCQTLNINIFRALLSNFILLIIVKWIVYAELEHFVFSFFDPPLPKVYRQGLDELISNKLNLKTC